MKRLEQILKRINQRNLCTRLRLHHQLFQNLKVHTNPPKKHSGIRIQNFDFLLRKIILESKRNPKSEIQIFGKADSVTTLREFALKRRILWKNTILTWIQNSKTDYVEEQNPRIQVHRKKKSKSKNLNEWRIWEAILGGALQNVW